MELNEKETIYYRTTYAGGNPVIGEKIYEVHTLCKCEDCQRRYHSRGTPPNSASAASTDYAKIPEMHHFLQGWRCQNGKLWQKHECFKF